MNTRSMLAGALLLVAILNPATAQSQQGGLLGVKPQDCRFGCGTGGPSAPAMGGRLQPLTPGGGTGSGTGRPAGDDAVRMVPLLDVVVTRRNELVVGKFIVGRVLGAMRTTAWTHNVELTLTHLASSLAEKRYGFTYTGKWRDVKAFERAIALLETL